LSGSTATDTAFGVCYLTYEIGVNAGIHESERDKKIFFIAPDKILNELCFLMNELYFNEYFRRGLQKIKIRLKKNF
jgi:hypothetical protein